MRRFDFTSSYVVAFGAALLATLVGANASAAVLYNVTDLGNLGHSSYPTAINSSGQIVGNSYADSAETQAYAFLYDASPTGSKTMIPLFGSGNYGNTANGINDSGQIVGSVIDAYKNSAGETVYQQDAYAESISGGVVTALSFNSSGQVHVGGAYTGSAAAANAVNNSGEIAGTVVLPGDSLNTQYGFTCDSGTSTIFPSPSFAAGTGLVASNNGINDSGIFVGRCAIPWSVGAGHLAYYFDPSVGSANQIHTPLDTGTVSYYAEANGINDSGLVVGGAVMSTTGAGTFHAYLYNIYGSGPMADLGALGTGDYSEAYGLNSAGQIVGESNLTPGGTSYHAFVCNSSGGMTDLNSVIPASSGWTLEDATAINASGWIVGVGIDPAGVTDGFLLTPVPEPSTIAILLAGAIGLLAFARHRRASRTIAACLTVLSPALSARLADAQVSNVFNKVQ